MNAGHFVEELTLNLGVMVTLVYLTSVIARSFPRTDVVRRSLSMIVMAIVAGWVTILLAIRAGDLVFDLRLLPGMIVALYARRAWIKELRISVAYLDIAFFKAINDRYGHVMGDVVLKDVGATIVQQIRPSDYCARLGGEEFVVILQDCPREQALQIAERVRTSIEATDFNTVDARMRVTLSIGVATSDPVEDALIEQADAALYRAKSTGRNRVVHAGDAALPASCA